MRIIFTSLIALIILLPCHAQGDLFELAETAYVNAEYDRAIELYDQSGSAYQAQNDDLGYSRCNLMKSSCLLLSGSAEASKEIVENTLAFLADNHPGASQLSALGLTLLGEAELNLGRNDLALDNLKKAEELFGPEASRELAECYENLGIIYWNNGNLDLSTQYHEKSLRMRQTLFGDRSQFAADSYNNLGVINLGVDGFKASLYLSRALSIYEEVYGPDHPKVAFCLTNLSRANSDEGNEEEGLQQLQRVVGIWDKLYEGDHPSKAFTLSNIGRLHAMTENWEEATSYQNRALAMYKSLFGEKHPEVANTYSLLGDIEQENYRWKEAIDFYQKAIYANLYDQNFEDRGDLPLLRNYYNADILLASLFAKAKVLEILHIDKSLKPLHLQQALDTYAKCDTLISAIRQIRENETDKIRLGRLAKEVYENAIRISLMLTEQPFARKKYLDIAFGYSERSKSAVLLEAISETKAKDFAGLPHEILQEEDNLKAELAYLNQQLAEKSGNQEEANLKNRLFEVQRDYRVLVEKIETDYPQYFELKYQTSTSSASEIAESLSPTEAVISYFEGDKRLYIFLVTNKGIDLIDKPKSENYQQLASGLRNAVKYRVPKVFLSSARSLYDELIPDLSSSITTLTIIPDGILGTIPFDALASPKVVSDEYENQQFLIEDYKVGYDYSATLFFNKRRQEKTGTSNEILFVAPVEFDEETGMATLEGTRREVSTIMYFFEDHNWSTSSLMEGQTSEQNFKKLDLASFGVLHFATHGLVHESKPELSKIFLRSDSSEDGLLYSGEIYNLKINADLVTLSACETGLGKLAKGEGIVGLSRSLLYAGAQNLIVSLWQVADQSTSDLMIRFYQEILEEKSGFSASLRQAKLSLLNSPEYKDPYYWAPFILIGQ